MISFCAGGGSERETPRMSNPFSCSFVAIANPNPREQPETMANGLAAAAAAADADDSVADIPTKCLVSGIRLLRTWRWLAAAALFLSLFPFSFSSNRLRVGSVFDVTCWTDAEHDGACYVPSQSIPPAYLCSFGARPRH